MIRHLVWFRATCRIWSDVSYRIGNEPWRITNLRPVIIPSNTRRQPRACKGRERKGRTESRRRRTMKLDEKAEAAGKQGLLLSSREQPEFLRLFFTVTPAVLEPTDRKRHAPRRIASYFMRGTWGRALYTNIFTWGGWLAGAKKEKSAEQRMARTEKRCRLKEKPTTATKGNILRDEANLCIYIYSLSKVVSFEVNKPADYARSAAASRLNIQLNSRMKFIRDQHRCC